MVSIDESFSNTCNEVAQFSENGLHSSSIEKHNLVHGQTADDRDNTRSSQLRSTWHDVPLLSLSASPTCPNQTALHLLAEQVAGLLLRLCGHQKVNHFLRSMPPIVTLKAPRSWQGNHAHARMCRPLRPDDKHTRLRVMRLAYPIPRKDERVRPHLSSCPAKSENGGLCLTSTSARRWRSRDGWDLTSLDMSPWSPARSLVYVWRNQRRRPCVQCPRLYFEIVMTRKQSTDERTHMLIPVIKRGVDNASVCSLATSSTNFGPLFCCSAGLRISCPTERSDTKTFCQSCMRCTISHQKVSQVAWQTTPLQGHWPLVRPTVNISVGSLSVWLVNFATCKAWPFWTVVLLRSGEIGKRRTRVQLQCLRAAIGMKRMMWTQRPKRAAANVSPRSFPIRLVNLMILIACALCARWRNQKRRPLSASNASAQANVMKRKLPRASQTRTGKLTP